MPIINPSLLSPIEYKSERYEFIDPKQSQPWVMFLRSPDDLELGAASDIEQEMTARFVTGGWTDDRGRLWKDRDVFKDVCGVERTLSKEVIWFSCRLYVMQDVDNPSDAYTPEQIAGMIPYYPTAMTEIRNVFVDLLNSPKDGTPSTAPS
ncbi:MAG: hypothetical protein GC165_07445 [Armatimonadetes bacterium]|nr:hypothetical protein [Armatimonadota bacterium]MBS1727374.1 hypothetical protein [Armatimonadota bacterium]